MEKVTLFRGDEYFPTIEIEEGRIILSGILNDPPVGISIEESKKELYFREALKSFQSIRQIDVRLKYISKEKEESFEKLISEWSSLDIIILLVVEKNDETLIEKYEEIKKKNKGVFLVLEY